jgi:hypothetical protein
MKSLSQSEYGELRSLYESVYAPKFESILDEFTDEDLDDLTDEYIEEQVTEFFQECLEEGFDIEILEETICESIDSELELLSEVTNPAKVAALRAKNKAAAAAGEGSGDAGAKARATLNVSKQKVGSASPEKKSSKLSKIKGAVKKVGKAVQGGVGLAARAVSTAQRAGSAVKSAAKKGYERGKKGSGSGSSTGSSSPSSSSSSGESSTYSSTPSSSSSSGSDGGSSSGTSAAPRKRKDGLLKRGLKKLVRGVSKGVSAAAGAVKAGADSITNRARKEQMNYNDVATIQELYNQMYAPQDVEEVYKGKHGQSDKEYADSRSQGGKMVSGDSKQSGAEYTHGRRVKAANPGMQPDVGGKTKPKSQGKMDRGTRADIEYRKANLKKEELEATGLFSEMEIEAIMEAEMIDENRAAMGRINKEYHRKKEAEAMASRTKSSKDKKAAPTNRKNDNPMYDPSVNTRAKNFKFTGEEVEVDEAMSSYDRNRKRAAERAAARNAARDAGKTGVVPGVGYVTPRRERETYVDSAGITRHKSGAKMPKD